MAPQHRMDRKQFLALVEPLDADRLRTVLWTLYWRGSAPLRERIEDELRPEGNVARKQREVQAPDGEDVLADVRRFVALARSGAYIGGTREVSPKQRTKWRFEFRDLVNDSLRVLRARDVEHGVPAVEQLVDLACECNRYTYFRSDDPVDAMKLVVSDVVEELWRTVLAVQGFGAFVAKATKELLAWDQEFGWTVRGFSSLCDKERRLCDVLAGMLRGADAWQQAADAYLEALDECIPEPIVATSKRDAWRAQEAERKARGDVEDRADEMVNWHLKLLDRLFSTDAEDRLDRIATHPALGGPELEFFRAHLAHRRGRIDEARKIMAACIARLPGHEGFLEFADRIGVSIPADTRKRWEERKAWDAQAVVDDDEDEDEERDEG